MQDFIAYTIAGLATAGIYAITASGLTLTYMTTGVFNFAHGAIGMIVAFCFWQLRYDLGWPPIVSWIVCLCVIAPLAGLVLERGVMRRLEGTAEVTRLVVTIALMLFLVSTALTLWGSDTFRTALPLFAGEVFEIASVRVAYNDAAVLLISALVALGLWMLLFKTRVGIAMRATVDDPDLSRLSGSSPVRSAQVAWVVSVMLAGLAGILIAPKLTLSPMPMTLLIVNAYAAAIIGRLRSLTMTFVGAIVLGLLTSYSVAYVDEIGSDYLTGFVGTLPVLVLFAALLMLRPSRLSGHAARSVRAAAQLTWKGGLSLGGACVIGSLMLALALTTGDLFGSTQMWGVAIVALSMIPLVGYAGRLSLCQITFAGVGAVVVAHAGPTLPALILTAVICAALGALVALPALRLSGIYMALSTAAIAVAFDRWIFKLPAFDFFGHEFDLFQAGSLTIDRPSIFGHTLDTSTAYLIFGAIMFTIMAGVVTQIRRSRFGARLLAISDSERAAASLGIDVRRHTLAVFSVSAAIAGIGGAVWGMALQTATPDGFAFFSGLPILLFMFVIGVDSPIGAALCGLLLGTSVITNLFPGIPELSALAVGALAIAIGKHPNGMAPVARAQIAALRQRPALMSLIIAGALIPWGLCAAGVIGSRAWLIWTFVVLPAVLPLAGVLSGESRKSTVSDDLRQGLSAPPETLGLTSPFRRRDAAALDRLLGLPRKKAADA